MTDLAATAADSATKFQEELDRLKALVDTTPELADEEVRWFTSI